VNSQDIDAMEAALVNLTGYAAGTTNIRLNNMQFDAPDLADIGDFDGDNVITNLDLQGMLFYLKTRHISAPPIGGGGNGSGAVPEPSSIGLLVLGTCMAAGYKLRNRRKQSKLEVSV